MSSWSGSPHPTSRQGLAKSAQRCISFRSGHTTIASGGRGGVGNISQSDVECRARTMRGTCVVSDGTVMTTGVAANPTCTVVVLAPRQAENIHEHLEAGAR
jgi:FtsZ-interacting cell division protein YlmF